MQNNSMSFSPTSFPDFQFQCCLNGAAEQKNIHAPKLSISLPPKIHNKGLPALSTAVRHTLRHKGWGYRFEPVLLCFYFLQVIPISTRPAHQIHTKLTTDGSMRIKMKLQYTINQCINKVRKNIKRLKGDSTSTCHQDIIKALFGFYTSENPTFKKQDLWRTQKKEK